MTRCPICGATAKRESESGNGIIFLKCSNNHTFERKLTPRQWEAEIRRRMATFIDESPDEARIRQEKLRRRKERRKRENEVFFDLGTLRS